MKKGQISIDLLLTLVVVILVVFAIGAIVLTYSEASERSKIQQELQYTANKTAALIISSQALSDTNFIIESKIGKIFYSDENKNNRNVYPTILVFDGNKINVSITFKGQKQDANAYFYTDADTQVNPSGTGVVISRAK